MNIKKTSSRKKIFIIILLAVLAGGAATAAVFYFKSRHNSSNDTSHQINYEKPSDTQLENGANARKEFESKETEASQQSKEAQGSSTEEAAPKQVFVQITRASASQGTLAVRNTIQVIDANGTCSLSIEKDGKASITKTAKTQTMGSYTTCQGFDIDITSLPFGTYTLKLIYTGSNKQAGSADKQITL